MKVALIHRERLLSLGQFLVDELDSLVSRIRASWNIEHTPEGGHANVTAQTVASGRLTFSDIAEVMIAEDQVNNFDPAGLSTAAILRLNSEQDEVSITGLHVPQDDSGAVLDGRVLVLENTSADTTFVLEAENTFSAPRNRISTPWGPPFDSNSPLCYYLRPSTLTVLIYNAPKARWLLHSDSNDNTLKYNTFAASQHDDVDNAAIKRVRTWRVEFAGTGGSFSGFEGAGVPETTRLTIVNAGLYKFSILHQSASSISANRVQCPGGVRFVVNPRESVELFKTANGWRILEKADQWIDVAHSAGNFTATGGVTPAWSVESADQATLSYQIDGNMMTVAFALSSTSVSGSPTQLLIAIPGGRVSARLMSTALAYVIDNGTSLDTGRAEVSSGGTTINLAKNTATAAWANSTNATHVRGQITFMVRDDIATIEENHSDVAHGDTAHSDVDHSDVSHSDVAHGDSHGDSAHSDTSHQDVAHVDTHSDTAHSDTAHQDDHDDVEHSDVAHSDSHGDAHVDNRPDLPHQDAHTDTHSDTEHSDVAHQDDHDDVAHSDVSHSDTHADTAHSDTAHVDTGHSDTHSDTTPHSDVAHVDVAHGDTAHADSLHQDVGYHEDNSHADI